MRFLSVFLFISCVFLSSIHASHPLPPAFFPIDSVEKFSNSMRYYEVLTSAEVTAQETDAKYVGDVRGKMQHFLSQNRGLVEENENHIFIKDMKNSYKILDYHYEEPIEKDLRTQIEAFKKRASAAQMSGALWHAHQNGIKGLGVLVNLIEQNLSSHEQHIENTVKQIAPLSGLSLSQIPAKWDYCPGKYSVINASIGFLPPLYPFVENILHSGALLIKSAGNEGAHLLETFAFLGADRESLLSKGMVLVGNLQSENSPSLHSNKPGDEKLFQDHFVWTLGSAVLAKVGAHTMEMSGTSMAAPIVTGGAALIAGQYPNFTKTDIKECILESARRDFFVENHWLKIIVHVSHTPAQSPPTLKDGYLYVEESYNPAIWGKGILDVKRALEYAKRKATGLPDSLKNFDEDMKKEEALNAIKIQALWRGHSVRTPSTQVKERQEEYLWNPDLSKSFVFAANAAFYNLLKYMGNQKSSTKGNTALHAAALYGYQDALKFLIEYVDVNDQNKEEFTALDYAILMDRVQIVEILLENGALVDIQDKNGKTPLHHAAYHGNTDIFNILKQHGAQQVSDHRGLTPDMILRANIIENGELMSLLCKMIDEGETLTKEDILNAGMNPNVRGDKNGDKNRDLPPYYGMRFGNFFDWNGDRPLHYAVRSGNKDSIIALVDAGANINVLNDNYETPLYAAIKCGYLDPKIIDTLLKLGSAVNWLNKEHLTPLHVAVENNNMNGARMLIHAGAKLKAKDKNNHTALDYAIDQSHKNMIELLLNSGAKE